MRIKEIALGACLLCVSTGFASDHYTVRNGDTVSGIAHRLGVSEKQLLNANELTHRHHLKPGLRLIVPTAGTSHRTAHQAVAAKGYKVKPGDNDESLAAQFHVSVRLLHKLNPEVKWTALRIGRELRVPGSHSLASVSSDHEAHRSSATYIVRRGDNDIRIARKLGISDRAVRLANPGVDWDALQIGHKLRVPGGAVAERDQPSEITTHYASIRKDNVNVRRAPRSSAGLITTVDEGTRVTVLDRDGNWYKVRFPRGSKGWVREDFLVATHVSSRTARHGRKSASHYLASRSDRPLSHANGDVLSTAQSLLGVPYRYGGTSRHGGLDCSAFTSTVFKSNGVTLPRTSREQSQVGHAVSRSQLKPGDLVFFKTGRSSRINHVAIYKGNGKFIHASSGGGEVMESSLNDGYYNRRFAAARRVAKIKTAPRKSIHSSADGTTAPTHRDAKHSNDPDEG